MKHLYKVFQRNNLIYRNTKTPRQMSQKEFEERYVDPAVLAETEGGEKAREERNKLREEVEPRRMRHEAEGEIQSYYDDIAKLREKVLALGSINKSSAELESLKHELALIESGISYSLWVFTERSDGLPEADKKWFRQEMQAVQNEVDAINKSLEV